MNRGITRRMNQTGKMIRFAENAVQASKALGPLVILKRYKRLNSKHMDFVMHHRKVLFLSFALLTLLHILNIFIFKNFYTTDFSYLKFWLLFVPAPLSLFLFIVLGFEYSLRKRKGIIGIIQLSFLSILSVGLLFISIMSVWNFGGFKYLFFSFQK